MEEWSRSKLRARRKCTQIMARYPNLEAQPVWREQPTHDPGKMMGRWCIHLEQRGQGSGGDASAG